MTHKTIRTCLTALACAATIVGGLAAPSSATVAETKIRPAQLERGADLAFPHVDGKTIVDGGVRVKVRAPRVLLLGPSGDDYVVATSNKFGTGHYRTFRVTAGGKRTPLLRGVAIYEQTLSGDGSQIARASTRRGKHTKIRVWSAADGERETTRRFPGAVSILDFDENRMVLGSFGPDRTSWWNVDSGATKRLVNRAGYVANIRANRFASLNGNPYDGGCSVTARLSNPAKSLWTSCKQAVREFAPKGGRTVTDFILSDGPGPSVVEVHRTHGRLVARYRAPSLFGAVRWETARKLTMETFTKKKGATVRCKLADCERATRFTKAPQYRVMPREQRAMRP